jgi:hypothetical protein
MTTTAHARFCLFALALILAGAAFSAPAAALRVEGARIALDAEPGRTYTAPIGISVAANEPEGDFAIDVLGFGQSTVDGTYVGLEAANDTSPYTARPFITVDRPTVHLKPGERADVTATIAVPADVREGGRYAIVLVHPAVATSGAPASFAAAVAIPVFLNVKGAAVSDAGAIEGLGPATADPGQPFQVTATLRNSGNRHVYGVVQNVTVADAGGLTVATAKTQPLERALVPGQSVRSAVAVNRTLSAGTYQLTSRMETQDGSLLGQETLTLQVGGPASTTTQKATTGFAALSAAAALAGLALLGRTRKGKGGG